MYYNRTLSESFSSLIENKGPLRWLFDYVKTKDDLDFLIGKREGQEWVSIYRGLTKILTVHLRHDGGITNNAAARYKKMCPKLYGRKSVTDNFQGDIERVRDKIQNAKALARYYDCKKEGYFQNSFSRRFGICGTAADDFVIIDKEAVIGYTDKDMKDKSFGPIQGKYKDLQKAVSRLNAKLYGKNLNKKAIGNELDFLALDKAGNILLIEFKHGTNTSGIYLSPLQIGLYYEVFTKFQKEKRNELDEAVFAMLTQKQKIGLINPEWNRPDATGDIIPILIISKYNPDSSSKTRYVEILDFIRKKRGPAFLQTIKTYSYSVEEGLTNLQLHEL